MTVDRSLWTLDPEVCFLNHGSFGACPRAVLEEQARLRAELEREPVRFMHGLTERLREAAGELAAFLGAQAPDLVFVQNATYGVNSVLRSLALTAGDELLVTTHEYAASRNALDFVAQRAGATVEVVDLPFPGLTPAQVVDAVLARVTPRTRLFLIDHVTSPTGVIMPLERLIPALRERGVETLVDGAHAPGMLDLQLDALGAGYYTGNCHKWLCTPKGSAFLHVRRDLQLGVRPLAISHGATIAHPSLSRFLLEFDWTGTFDPTAALSVPFALRYLGGLLPGGWAAVRQHNHDLVVAGRQVLLDALGIPAPCPASMLGSLASVPLPPDPNPDAPLEPLLRQPPIQAALTRRGIQVPVVSWPRRPARLIRISAQLYTTLADYERLAAALLEELEAERG